MDLPTREEREVGFDASIEGAEGYALFLRFKRPLMYYGTNPKEISFMSSRLILNNTVY